MVPGCLLRARLSIRDVPWRILGPIDPSATIDAILRTPDLPSVPCGCPRGRRDIRIDCPQGWSNDPPAWLRAPTT